MDSRKLTNKTKKVRSIVNVIKNIFFLFSLLNTS